MKINFLLKESEQMDLFDLEIPTYDQLLSDKYQYELLRKYGIKIDYDRGDNLYKLIQNNKKIYMKYSFYASKIKSISYFKNNKGHRENGPAYIKYDGNGNIKEQGYYINGKRHREDGPALIIYWENGNKMDELYYVNDLMHRKDGPAAIYYDEDETIEEVQYWKHGIKYKNNET